MVPKKPVNGVKWPIRILSDCALTMAGNPIAETAPTAEPAMINRRRVSETSFIRTP